MRSLESDKVEGRTGAGFLVFYLLLISEIVAVNYPPENRENKRDKFRCLYLFMDDFCICREGGLRRAIENNESKSICRDTDITVTRVIDISDKSFAIFCDSVVTKKGGFFDVIYTYYDYGCSITAKGTNGQLFTGKATNSVFKNIAITGA